MASKKINLPRLKYQLLRESTQFALMDYGFSIYQDIMIIWDKGGVRQRVLEIIDLLPNDIKKELLILHYSKNEIELYWNDGVPSTFNQTSFNYGKGIVPIRNNIYEKRWWDYTKKSLK